MRVEDNNLILDEEVNNEMLEEFMKLSSKKKLKTIVIETDNISSLVVQQLFCIAKEKKILCNDPFLNKFFDDVRLVG